MIRYSWIVGSSGAVIQWTRFVGLSVVEGRSQQDAGLAGVGADVVPRAQQDSAVWANDWNRSGVTVAECAQVGEETCTL